jgi:undecaprenyl diphosphate synthase
MTQKTLPRHIGFIPDGNRRWSQLRGMPKAWFGQQDRGLRG